MKTFIALLFLAAGVNTVHGAEFSDLQGFRTADAKAGIQPYAFADGTSLPMPQVYSGPSGVRMVRELKVLLLSTAGLSPDPLGADRAELTELLKPEEPESLAVKKFFDKYLAGAPARPAGASGQNGALVPGGVPVDGVYLPMPAVYNGPSGVQRVRALKDLLRNTAGLSPDPLGADRGALTDLLEPEEPDAQGVAKFYVKYIGKL